jgi:hypothetical protein
MRVMPRCHFDNDPRAVQDLNLNHVGNFGVNSRRFAFQFGERARGGGPSKSFGAASKVSQRDSQLHRSIGNPTFHPTDHSDTTGQIFFDSRMIPTSPDQSDHMHPSFSPKVPGSRLGRPTMWTTVRRRTFTLVDPNDRATSDGDRSILTSDSNTRRGQTTVEIDVMQRDRPPFRPHISATLGNQSDVR